MSHWPRQAHGDYHLAPNLRRLQPTLAILADATVPLDLGHNEPQPDVVLRIGFEVGGRSRLGTGDHVEGPLI